MNAEDPPIVRSGRVTLLATYGGDGFLDTPNGPVDVAGLENVRRGDRVLREFVDIRYPEEFGSMGLNARSVLQFVACVSVRRTKGGWRYKLSRCEKFRVLPPSKGG